jgi:hypothetical protein
MTGFDAEDRASADAAGGEGLKEIEVTSNRGERREAVREDDEDKDIVVIEKDVREDDEDKDIVSIGNDEDEVRTDEIGPKLTGF